MKHTPGPWFYKPATKPDNIGGYDYGIYTENKRIIAEAFEITAENVREPVKANAQLIAAAPDLLEALTNLLAHVNCLYEFGVTGFAESIIVTQRAVKEQSKAAIAKAEGK